MSPIPCNVVYLAANYITDVDKEIVGGRPAKKGQFPWIVGIWHANGRSPFCGGSIVARK